MPPLPATLGHTRAELIAAVSTMSDRFVRLGLSCFDSNVAVPATPGWSVTDVFGHAAIEPRRYRDLALGRGIWPRRVADLPAFNANQIRSLPTRDMATLATTLRAETDSLLTTIVEFGDNPPLMSFDGDQRVRADRALGILLGEFVVHGHDIAEAIHQPWQIDPALVPMILEGLNQVLPGWVKPSSAVHTATYELRIRGLARYVYAFGDGRLSINPPEYNQIDVHISAEPVTALLVNYGRIGPVLPALTGKVRVWGRRPWLALSMRNRFYPA